MASSIHLIETIRVRNGVAPLWYLHLRRLATSCQALGVRFPVTLIPPAGDEDRLHRLEVGARGVDVSERPVGSTSPVRLVVSRVPHRPYPHKTTDRAPFEDALAEAQRSGADDALLLVSGAGYVAEAAAWSVFWWEGDVLCAPSLELGVLPGVARARLAELAGRVLERRVTLDALASRSLFVANAGRGIVPVVTLDGRAVPPTPATGALAARFWPTAVGGGR